MQEQRGGEKRCALVLGGGGPLGIAWEAGMLAGWAESWQRSAALAEVPLAPFLDGRIVGTSAGAIVGAHLAVHGSVTALLQQQGEPVEPDAPSAAELARFLPAYFKARLFTRNVDDFRRSLGRSARRSARPGEQHYLAAFRRSYAPGGPWPAGRDLRIMVIDTETGELHTWTSERDAPLAVAVAASCSIPCAFPMVHVNGRTYMDGGLGSPTNALLAQGCERVLILDPLGRVFGKSAPIEAERETLEAAGSHTLAFTPDQAVANSIGRNFLDSSRRALVAKLARAQGLATAPGVRSFLEGSGVRPSQEQPISPARAFLP